MDMRLFKRGKIWQIEVSRDKRISTGLTDEKEAKKVMKELQKDELYKKLAILDKQKRVSISEFSEIYCSDTDRKNLSWKTLQADNLSLNLLSDAIGDISLKMVNTSAIKKFKDITVSRVKQTSVNSYLMHIRAALRWAKKEGYIDRVPEIKFYKIGKRLPRCIPQNDLVLIMDTAKKTNPEMARIIRFAIYTGCRRKEIINARYEHIRGGVIRIIGKGDKERIVPLLPQALDITQDVGKIFSYRCGTTISNYFQRITSFCGVKARFHDLRHTAATQMLSEGIDLKVVKDILGHSDIRTTEIYAHVLEDMLSKQMKKLRYGFEEK